MSEAARQFPDSDGTITAREDRVLESGNVSYPETGTPQGGVVSPLLANVFLHEVVDVWFEHTVKPRLKGRARLVRYADDMLMVFGREDDARRVLAVLPKRFEKYGLALHPEKTRLVSFRRPRSNDRGVRSRAQGYSPVVSDISASQGHRAAAGAASEGERALRVLRANRQLERPG